MVEKLRLSKGRYIQSQAIHHAGTFPQTAPPHRPCSQYRQYRLKKKLLPRQPCPSGGHNLEADFSWARAADSSCQVSESDSSCWDRLKLLLPAQPGSLATLHHDQLFLTLTDLAAVTLLLLPAARQHHLRAGQREAGQGRGGALDSLEDLLTFKAPW